MKKTFKELIKDLVRLNNTPPEIALGVAIGVFIAITPLYGLHTVMFLAAAILVRRANKIAILLGTNISIPPTLPFISWAAYDIGRFILNNGYPPLSWSYFKNMTFKRLWEFYLPLFIGSLILGLILAVIFYFITLIAVNIIRKRRVKRGLEIT
ncbi:MAG: DUF2062 domain-containing protein [Candidatus Omnitrophica bacterium]|nr:DUF2062 domain-containing protein [Candidatus Omnitrophota bacterium]